MRPDGEQRSQRLTSSAKIARERWRGDHSSKNSGTYNAYHVIGEANRRPGFVTIAGGANDVR